MQRNPVIFSSHLQDPIFAALLSCERALEEAQQALPPMGPRKPNLSTTCAFIAVDLPLYQYPCEAIEASQLKIIRQQFPMCYFELGQEPLVEMEPSSWNGAAHCHLRESE